jgi:hypothetical protein
MTMTDNDLRDLLARDASTGRGAGVTLADVDRRVRRIRRRRGAAGAVLAAGLAAVVMAATVPRTVTIAPADAPGTATAATAVPSPSPRERYFAGPRVFLTKKIETGGRILRYSYTGTSPSVNVQIGCGEPAYAFVWLNGRLEGQGLCGIQSDQIDHLLSWTDQSGRNLRGRNEVGVAVVPAARVTADGDAGDPVPALGEQEAARVIGETGEYRTSAWMTVREAALPVVMPFPTSCGRDIVIRRPNGQEILSSACDPPSVPAE